MKKEKFLGLFAILICLSMVAAPIVATQAIESNTEVLSQKVLEQVVQEPGAPVDVLIQTNTKDYRSIADQISALGGKVTHEFKYATGLAAELPANRIMNLKSHPNVNKISLDAYRHIDAAPRTPTPTDLVELEAEGITTVSLTPAEIQASLSNPETYWNYESMGATDVWATGNFGQGSLVVVIDTGVYAGHVMFGHGAVIGGIDLSADVGTEYEGFDLPSNHWHGTHVAGIIAGAAGLALPPTHPLYLTWSKYTGQDTGGYIDLLGMAPLAQIYGIKIFDHTGAGVPESEVIASMEYAIDLHLSGTYDVDVISMSLGGGTGFDGRDLEDQTADYATSVGITLVTSAGNDGPASMTTGSPGTANTAISVGAVSHPVNSKIYYDYRYGIGDYIFPDDKLQIAAFSSRGPTSDGRDKPTVAATGVWVLSAYTSSPGGLAWAGGTSMACPAVSGAVALLNVWGDAYGAAPYDYKEAIRNGAIWIEGYDKYDQGAGFLNAANALDALMNDPSLGDDHPGIKKWYKPFPVKPKGINTKIGSHGTFTYDVDPLLPGHAIDFYLKTTWKTKSIKIELLNVATGVDPIGFNGFELFVQSPVRSSEDYFIDTWIYGDAVVDITDFNTTASGALFTYASQDMQLQSGYVRIVLQNEWDSYDWVSGTIKITVEKKKCKDFEIPDKVYAGTLETGEEEEISVDFGASGVKLELSWVRDWTLYPTSDLDMIIEWFDGVEWHTDTSGGSFRESEVVYIISPDIQEIQVTIIGAETYEKTEPWLLSLWYLE
ncbi:MAG: S8 family serine peptidase [Candidatus Hodarchaeota archaeon]